MRYIYDNDLHIHSKLSSCSNDPDQTAENILRYAKSNGLNTICLTDHFWDSTVVGASNWYQPQNYEHIAASLPLPQDEDIRFLFGCETELDRFLTLGVSKETIARFDFVIIPTTHFHMRGFTISNEEAADAQSRANAWIQRLDTVLNMDLPFHKIGLAHMTCPLIAPTREQYLQVLELIPKKKMEQLFQNAACLGIGIELNLSDMNFSDEEADMPFTSTTNGMSGAIGSVVVEYS